MTPEPDTTPAAPLPRCHRFLDECGDTTFFGKARVPVLGKDGVSLAFGLGLVKFNIPVEDARSQVKALAGAIEGDEFFRAIPSVQKRIAAGGFHFHAKDDVPEIRERLFRWIKANDLTLELVMARKIPAIFAHKHNHHENEFYADLLSHLLKTKLKLDQRLVINIASRGSTTRQHTLDLALEKARQRFAKKHDASSESCEVVFNVQTPQTEPLLSVADYLSWAVQRVFERGDTRYYDYIRERVAVVVDLYDSAHYEKGRNYYTPKRPLTATNKLSPPTP